jgi:2-iminobutanoate/2-iminopropanoate deaminase
MRETISTPDAPGSPLFAQAVRAGQQVWVSGMVGVDVTTGRLAGPTIQEQTRQALHNGEVILQAAGAARADIVEVGVLIVSPADFAGMNEAYAAWCGADPPARYVARLGPEPPGVLVSIRMTAVTG